MLKKEQLAKLVGQMTTYEMAKHLNCGRTTVVRYMKKFGLNQPKEFVYKKRLESSSMGGKALKGVVKDKKPFDITSHKVCPHCKEKKVMSDFYFSTKDRNSVSSYCKKCSTDNRTRSWIQKKLKAIEYKGGKCKDCSNIHHYAIFEFHHIDNSNKEAEWRNMRKWGWDKIKIELDKCDLLCANCHRMRHVKEGL